jgi:hypothetical protein
MTWFADLTPYTYHIKNHPAVNVGWLDRGHPFEKELPSDELIKHLLFLTEGEYNAITHHFMGSHECHFCERAVPTNIGLWRSGNGTLLVTGKDGTQYAAPKLIYHYVLEHHYKPPQEFIDAVMGTNTTVRIPCLDSKGNPDVLLATPELAEVLQFAVSDEGQEMITEEINKEIIRKLKEHHHINNLTTKE